jgi:HSP20 family protein
MTSMEKQSTKGGTLQRQEPGTPERVQQRPSVTPSVDIYENDSELLLVADLPGVTRDNLKIHLDHEQLSIEGSRHTERAGSPLAEEFRQVDYHRAFVVPQGIDVDKINADLRQGVLYLHLPKSEAIKPRQITVKAG